MMNKRIRKAVLAVLGTAALAGVSGQAGAWTATNIGTGVYDGTVAQSVTSTTPYKAWADYNAGYNMGWAHTAKWYKIQIGTATNITNGDTLNVQVKLNGTDTHATLDNTMLWGGFTMWTTGTSPVVDAGSGTAHAYLQTRGPGDGPNNLDIPSAAGTPNGIVDYGNYGLNDGGTGSCAINGGSCSNVIYGHDGWVGYGNTGRTFTNMAGDTVSGQASGGTGGEINTVGGTAVTGTGSWVDNSVTGTIALNLFGLKAGYYLFQLGGNCADYDPSCAKLKTGGSAANVGDWNYNGPGAVLDGSGNPTNALNARGFTFTIGAAQAAPVPVPAAVWLFGSALAGMGVIGRRKDKPAA